ncbi:MULTISPECIES: M23 family metallopeptidase [Sphingobium]|uniref:M23 family metallopeptidase n=1 Tax=Sphingobium sp. MI1205 TaxID=407020 RepID=UPI000AE9ADC2|nr:M23 family metallopeptidase [Sphingobium sp. MI1205]
MLYRTKKRVAALWVRIITLCPEREIFLRSDGQVKFIRISTRVQLLAAALLCALLMGAAALSLSMVSDRSAVAHERAAIDAERKAVAKASDKVESYRRSVETLARDLQARQDFMDDLYRTHFGDEESDAAEGLVGKSDKAAAKGGSPALKLQISASSEAQPLLTIDARQRRFAMLLTDAVKRRADKTAAAIRSFGLNPDALARTAARAQGGPFVPWRGQRDAMPQEFERLTDALSRMEFLESSLMTIPSGRPTLAPMQSSSYGYRRDPFNGHAAFHAGIDFPGSHGQPILAAAAGKISFVGQRSGYGNVVEVSHGNGLMTRYAHLSGFAARVGQQVGRGAMIARMGSTGRSTGDHLHFEVRLNGEPINPRRFLDARKDVLQVQRVATARLADVGDRG